MSKREITYLILLGVAVGSFAFSIFASSLDCDPSALMGHSSQSLYYNEPFFPTGSCDSEDPAPPLSDFLVYDPVGFNNENGSRALGVVHGFGAGFFREALRYLNADFGKTSVELVERTVFYLGRLHFFLQQVNYALFNSYKDGMPEESQAISEQFFKEMKIWHSLWLSDVGPHKFNLFTIMMISDLLKTSDSPDEKLVLRVLNCCMCFNYLVGSYNKGSVVQFQLQQTQAILVLSKLNGRYCFELLPQKRYLGDPEDFETEMLVLKRALVFESSYKALHLLYSSLESFFKTTDLELCDPSKLLTPLEIYDLHTKSIFWQSLIRYKEGTLYSFINGI